MANGLMINAFLPNQQIPNVRSSYIVKIVESNYRFYNINSALRKTKALWRGAKWR